MKLMQKLKLIWAILTFKPSNQYAHAEKELPPAGDDDMQAMMNEGILNIVAVFSTQGHSGFSSSYAIAALEKLLRFELLRPLTGEDDEWMEIGDNLYQNIRCSRVFKDSEGAYDIEGKIFREPSGCSYTNRESRINVTFPYTPHTEYVDVQS